MLSNEGVREFLDGLQAEGWVPNPDKPDEVASPSDPEMIVSRHPVTGALVFSPKLTESIKADFARRGWPLEGQA